MQFVIVLIFVRFPAMNHLISLMVGLAPVANVQHMTSPIRYIAPVAEEVEVQSFS